MSLLDGFEIVPLSQDDERVQTRVNAFYKHIGIAKARRSDVVKWFGLCKNGIVGLVVAIFARPDGSLEITDFYPAPTRDGVKAGYAAFRILKALVDEGLMPYWITGVVDKNAFGKRHVEKFFGIKPTSTVYQYGEGAS